MSPRILYKDEHSLIILNHLHPMGNLSQNLKLNSIQGGVRKQGNTHPNALEERL